MVLSASQDIFQNLVQPKQFPQILTDNNALNIEEDSTRSELNHPDEPMTPKSQKPPDTKRWASVVKAKKKIQNSPKSSPRSKHRDENQVPTNLLNDSLKSIPKNFENHLSFISSKDSTVSCSLCQAEFDNVPDLSNHIKTRKHEDNIIEFLKAKLPVSLHNIMEFITFYDSNLCCNLCRCQINVTYGSPHKTLLDIIAHNSDKSHTCRKANRDTNNLAQVLFNTLADGNPEIMEMKHFVDKKMNPQYRCKLCNKNIQYDDDVAALENNFISHITSISHTKNKKAIETLKLFRETSTQGFDNFVIFNGNIKCTFCNHPVESDLQKLILHENGVEHAKNALAIVNPNSNKYSEKSAVCKDNKINEAISSSISNNVKIGNINIDRHLLKVPTELSESKEKNEKLPGDFNNIFTKNTKGSVICLICKCVVPSNGENLRLHQAGNNHKKNQELHKNLQCENRKPIKPSLTKVFNDATTVNKQMPKQCDSYISQVKAENNGNFSKNSLNKTSAVNWCNLSSENKKMGGLGKTIQSQKEKFPSKKCNDCPGKISQEFSIVNKVPQHLRTHKCNEKDTVPKSVIEHLYSIVSEKNAMISKNENVIVRNVDGRHSYCKLCKCLIPLSLDINLLESNLLTHLYQNKHVQMFLKLDIGNKKNNADLTEDISDESGVLHGLFSSQENNQPTLGKEDVYCFGSLDFDCVNVNNQNIKKETEFEKPSKEVYSVTLQNSQATNFADSLKQKKILRQILLPQVQKMYPELAEKVVGVLLKRDEKELSQMLEQKQTFKTKVEDAVNCIQAEAAKRKSLSPQPPNQVTNGLKKESGYGKRPNKILCEKKNPDGSFFLTKISRAKYEIETDEEVLSRRQKQIDYGKNTEGYTHYCAAIPKRKRESYHPGTPPKDLKCSRRTWDGMIRVWRRQLHDWDPPTPSPAQDLDVKPLPL